MYDLNYKKNSIFLKIYIYIYIDTIYMSIILKISNYPPKFAPKSA